MEKYVDKNEDYFERRKMVEKIFLKTPFTKVFHTFYMKKDINLLNLHQIGELWIKCDNN